MSDQFAALWARISQLETLIGQMVQRGPVVERDAKRGYRIQTGTDLDGNPVLSPWQPHPESGKTSIPMPLGQNVGILNPTGDPRQGYPLRVGYSDKQPSPSEDMDENVLIDDAGVRMVAAGGRLSITCEAGVFVTCGDVTHHITTEGVTTTGGSMSHDGLDVGSSHKHTKVMPGGGVSGVPAPKA
ncbi:MAG: baseplate assembly protein [Pseudomonadota bacterium]|nr:baseplate assembly protein [Pseudomonadota bacterium]